MYEVSNQVLDSHYDNHIDLDIEIVFDNDGIDFYHCKEKVI